MSRAALLLAAALLALPGTVRGAAADASPSSPSFVAPGPRARCPVCGMFVAPFPEWQAQVVFPDGHRESFDGVSDLVRFLADLPRYAPGRAGVPIVQVWVTDYYGVAPIPAAGAHFVSGSDVTGPMGPEYVPHETREQAEEFLRDHRGTAVLGFDDLAAHLLGADSGVKR